VRSRNRKTSGEPPSETKRGSDHARPSFSPRGEGRAQGPASDDRWEELKGGTNDSLPAGEHGAERARPTCTPPPPSLPPPYGHPPPAFRRDRRGRARALRRAGRRDRRRLFRGDPCGRAGAARRRGRHRHGGPAAPALPRRLRLAGDRQAGELRRAAEIRFEPFSFALGGTEVAVAPFAWDYASVRVSGKWDDLATRLFADWHHRAFGDDEPEDNIHLQNVIHTATTPEITDTGYAFEADFGTAPASTMSDLLLALLGNAPDRIEIGMPDGGSPAPARPRSPCSG
jgi:hypothetical protein